MTGEPALGFWLRYVEREGALVDAVAGTPLAVLTPALQRRLGLPETVAVTSDPDVAREDGALFLAPGHPVLDAAAEGVLEAGDVGTIALEWPQRTPPGGDQLLALARDRVGVDHGRIDLAGPPESRYAPVLRVGVQITYSINDRFHEREEVWVDARSRLPLSEEVVRCIDAAPRLAGPGRLVHPRLEADLEAAVRAAHLALDERAAARQAALARQAGASMRDELAQAERYYEASLESIARRRSSAPEDRRSLYDARAEAVRAERARRLEEIREKYAARREVRPVRLHLVVLPALHLPLVVRRGARTFPFALTWWLRAARFADVRCPSCGSPSALVAAKDRLGCATCVEPRAAAPPAPVPQAPPAPGPSQPPPPARRPAARPAAARTPPAAAPPEPARDQARLRSRVHRTGAELGHRLWESVLNGDPWPRRRADPDSPLRAVYRLFGVEAPLRAIGVPEGALPDRTVTRTADAEPPHPMLTRGEVGAGALPYPFTLLWRLEGGKPVLLEVVPSTGWRAGELGPLRYLSPRLTVRVPDPVIELDPVAAALWQRELPAQGLPVVARCLAAWWRIAGDPRLPPEPAPVLAAALAAMVARRAGSSRTRKAAAADHGATEAAIGVAARRLQALLGLSEVRWW